MSEVATIIATSVGALGTLGAAAKFVWGRVEARFSTIESKLIACETRERESQQCHSVQLTVIELLWSEVDRLDPTSNMLKRSQHHLDKLKREVQS